MIFQSILTDFLEFIKTKTNVTVLQCAGAEGDDFLARWPQVHPDDEHIICSGDSDVFQLLNNHVSIYDGVNDRMIKMDGVYDAEGQPMEFKVRGGSGKIKVGEPLDLLSSDFEVMSDWWKYALFVKCIRGDSGDGIFSAYPKVRETKLIAAWDDRLDVGYNWNNLMLQEWVDGKDENGNDVRVLVRDKYAFNKSLIDLTLQPQSIKDLMDQTIIDAVQKPLVTQVGVQLMKFCTTQGLINIKREAADHAVYLQAPYSK